MSDGLKAAVSTAPPPPPPLPLNPDGHVGPDHQHSKPHTRYQSLRASPTPSFSFGRTAPPPSWCPTTHLVNDPSAEDFRPVRVELKDQW